MRSVATFCCSMLVFVLSVGSLAADAPRSPIKNVLFIISDDLRASALRCYGDKFCRTPNIDKLAREGMVFNRAYCQGTVCGPSRTSFMFSRYKGRGTVNLGQHFKANGRYSARVGKIYHMRVPGDIIAGTNGQDIPESWTERFNSQGNEAHTPGDYACLNLNIFTSNLEGRQSTKMPHRMFVSVKYEGDGADQPDHKTATKTIELLRQHGEKPFFIAAGFVRPHYPMVAPNQYFDPYPWQDMIVPDQIEGDEQQAAEGGGPAPAGVAERPVLVQQVAVDHGHPVGARVGCQQGQQGDIIQQGEQGEVDGRVGDSDRGEADDARPMTRPLTRLHQLP